MSEYWVSKKKYYCKYCETFIADDAPSRQQHENGLRHQGNKERFVRGLYKTSEKMKKEAAEEKREMKRVEDAAQAAFAGDVHMGHAKASSSSSTSLLQKTTPPVQDSMPPARSTNPYANYSTPASLGYTDPDEDRILTEALLRQSEGRVGAWTTVTPAYPTPPVVGASSSEQTRKREREVMPGPAPADDDGDERRFKFKKKVVAIGLGEELWEPGVIQLKKRPGIDEPEPQLEVKSELLEPERPTWTSRGWKKAGESDADLKDESKTETVEELLRPAVDGDKPEVKVEPPSEISTDPDPPTTVDDKPSLTDSFPPSSGGNMFKKRKAPPTVGPKKGARRQL